MIARVFDGKSEGSRETIVLDNITFYWFTNTAVSSARLYWKTSWRFRSENVSIPAAVSAFPEDIDVPAKSWAEKAYPKLIHFNRLDKGGHFAAWTAGTFR